MTLVAPAPTMTSPVPTFDVMGVPVSAIDPCEAEAAIEAWVASGARQYVCITGVHGVIESRTDPVLRRSFRNAGLVTPDGMPLVWTAWLRGLVRVRRVYGPDLMLSMSGTRAGPGLRHYYYGGGSGVAERLRDRMLRHNPSLLVVGCDTPPFRALTRDEEATMLATINAARPDILWIGLSTPKQDLWMHRYRDRLDVPVIVGVGAAFDFLSGTKKQAPHWLRGTGFEWVFRLISEPRRLFTRYVYIVPPFSLFLLKESLRASLKTVIKCFVA